MGVLDGMTHANQAPSTKLTLCLVKGKLFRIIHKHHLFAQCIGVIAFSWNQFETSLGSRSLQFRVGCVFGATWKSQQGAILATPVHGVNTI